MNSAITPMAVLPLVLGSDGKWRFVPVTARQSSRIMGFIRQEMGGTIQAKAEPITWLTPDKKEKS